jgi:type II secretory pathway pseudopilin PulG
MEKNKGFTLFEAVTAIAVVTLLAGILVPMTIKYVKRARIAKATSDLKVIGAAVAQQIADTGAMPRSAVAGGPDGTGNAVWYSAGDPPGVVGGGALPDPANNRFNNLFDLDDPLGMRLFNLGAMPYGGQHAPRYRRPYLGGDVATRTDPWGRAYVILGYNENGHRDMGAVWIVCAGPDSTINAGNLGLGGARLPRAWNYGLPGSERNIVLRVH